MTENNFSYHNLKPGLPEHWGNSSIPVVSFFEPEVETYKSIFAEISRWELGISKLLFVRPMNPEKSPQIPQWDPVKDLARITHCDNSL